MYFEILSIIAFASAVVFAALGSLSSASHLPEDDLELIADDNTWDLLLLIWDSREFYYPTVAFFILGLFGLVLA